MKHPHPRTKRAPEVIDVEIVEVTPRPSTSAALVRAPAPGSAAIDRPRPAPGTGRDLVDLWLEGRTPQTREAYGKDIAEFGRFLKLHPPQRAAAHLISFSHGEANELVLSYRNALVDAGLAPATVNRRLASLRSVVKLANTLGRVPWTLAIPNVQSQRYKDTRGPDEDAFALLLAGAKKRKKPQRDLALLHLLHDMALRRSEVAELSLEHVDLARGRLSVLGKGKRERHLLSMPTTVRAKLAAWIDKRGQEPGSLFGLSDGGIYQIVTACGREAEVGHVRPHGLRHSGITRALDATGGDVRKVRGFSRHADIKTVLIYDDARRDDFGTIAELVATRGKQK